MVLYIEHSLTYKNFEISPQSVIYYATTLPYWPYKPGVHRFSQGYKPPKKSRNQSGDIRHDPS
jgi:hypothetical protein